MKWKTETYQAFINERNQPAMDLVNRIQSGAYQKIIDLGSGPGNSTAILTDYFPNASIKGVDASLEMLEVAKANYPNIKFAYCKLMDDINILDQDYDLIFSNACLHWVADHKIVFKQLLQHINENGTLAVQMPIQQQSKMYQIIQKIVEMKQFSELTFQPSHVLSISDYYDILSSDTNQVQIYTTTYYHKLNSHEDIIKWYESTSLAPYLEQVHNQDALKQCILEELKQCYQKQEDGSILLDFPRVFIIVHKL